jgi:hypothetical protein
VRDYLSQVTAEMPWGGGRSGMGMADRSTETVVGKLGRVITRVRGTDRAGEIIVQIRGGTETFLAYADEEIGVGASVLVIDTRGARSVDVVRFGR